MANDTRSRRWTITLNNIPDGFEEHFRGDGIVFSCFQHELAPTTGHHHIQGFIHYETPKRESYLKGIFPGGHFEVAKGSDEKNQKYCNKEETRMPGSLPFSFGVPEAGQGHRSDLDEVVAFARVHTLLEVSDAYPSAYLRFARSLEALQRLQFQPRDHLVPPYVCLVWGATGSGKTRLGFQKYPAEAIYMRMGAVKWWDGYRQQPVVILDEFSMSPETPASYWLAILDRYPISVEVKGAMIPLRSKVFILTTTQEPMHLFGDRYVEFMRRMHVFHFPEECDAALQALPSIE